VTDRKNSKNGETDTQAFGETVAKLERNASSRSNYTALSRGKKDLNKDRGNGEGHTTDYSTLEEKFG